MPELPTVRHHVAWSYANLARAHAALTDNATKYSQIHHIIRNKLFYGLCNKAVSMRTIYDDERLKMTLPQTCAYCGSSKSLSLDHLFPRKFGGSDAPENLIWACRSCNSSKAGRDLLEWCEATGRFPSIFILRRYLKNVARYCEDNNIFDSRLEDIDMNSIPFNLARLPHNFPPLSSLVLWVPPVGASSESDMREEK